MKKAMVIINPTSGGEKALDYKEKLENKAKEYFEYVETKITEKALDATHFAKQEIESRLEFLLNRVNSLEDLITKAKELNLTIDLKQKM